MQWGKDYAKRIKEKSPYRTGRKVGAPRASQVAWAVKNPPAESIPGREDPLEEEMAICSSSLAWRIPRTVELGGLQSMGLQKSRTWLKRLSMHTGASIWWSRSSKQYNEGQSSRVSKEWEGGGNREITFRLLHTDIRWRMHSEFVLFCFFAILCS